MTKIFRVYDDAQSLFVASKSVHEAEQIGRSIGLASPVARYVVTSADTGKTIARLNNELRTRTRNK